MYLRMYLFLNFNNIQSLLKYTTIFTIKDKKRDTILKVNINKDKTTANCCPKRSPTVQFISTTPVHSDII